MLVCQLPKNRPSIPTLSQRPLELIQIMVVFHNHPSITDRLWLRSNGVRDRWDPENPGLVSHSSPGAKSLVNSDVNIAFGKDFLYRDEAPNGYIGVLRQLIDIKTGPIQVESSLWPALL